MGVRDRGWTHHIQRLMVLGNHALQRGYRPDELTEWFATAYVDGFRWVMPTNVVGMSQHADGGRLATKPYASGGAYINKMSDHCGDCAYDPKKRLGDDACPFTAGYWNFVHRHRELLAKNNRTQRAVVDDGPTQRPRRRARAGVGAPQLLTRSSPGGTARSDRRR